MPVINNTDTLLVRGKDGEFIPIAVIKGDPGRGVLSVIRTEGDGSPGSTDVYTITFTDGGTTQFTVYNGRNGGSDIPPEIIANIVKQYFEDNPIDPADLGAVSADQGAENADKILGIGEDGKVIPVDKPQGDVKTVAGVKPDASGNVPLTASDVGAATKEQLNTLSGEVAKKQPAGNYATKEEIPAVPVQSVNGKTGAVKLTASDVGARGDNWMPTAEEVGALPSSTEIPANTSDLKNDSGFITKAVSDLANYYRKNETYTQAEVNALISAIPKFTISVVSALPTTDISTTTIYLVGGGSGDDLYTEYIYANNKWEILGSQRVDLTGYATETWVSAQISAYMTAENIAAALGYTPANSADLASKANRSGWAGNKYLGTDAAGNMVTRDAPAGEGGGTGTPGADGISPIAKVEQLTDGAKITITDATGTTEASIYNGKDGADGAPGKDGQDGAPGADGDPGKDGTSVTVTNVTESTEDGGENVVTFSDGTIVKIRNGSKGSDGAPGADGKDYTLTETDITNIASQAATQIDVSGKLDKSGGTMTGKLVAQNNADHAVKQVRNIIQVEQGAAKPDGADGDICIVYQLT